MKRQSSNVGRIAVPHHFQAQMVEVARAFRKAPTKSEETLWRVLRTGTSGRGKFRRQQPIGPFVVDFYCPEHRLILEVDGPIHDGQRERDLARQQLLEACDFRILRVTSEEVETDLPAVLRRIDNATALRISPLAP